MIKVAVIGSGVEPEVLGNRLMQYLAELSLEQEVCIITGDKPGVEATLSRSKGEYPVVLIRPYGKYDKSTEFKQEMFFVANRQKIDNADEVILVGDSEHLNWCEEYALKRGCSVQRIQEDV